MALFHTSPYYPWMLYKTLQVGYCLWTETHKRLLWSQAVSFSWVSVHVSAWVTWLYSEESGKFSQKLVKKNVGYFWPATFYPPPTKIYPRHKTRAVSILSLFLASLSSNLNPPIPLLALSSSAPTPPRRCWAARPYSHWHTQFLFCFGRRQTDIFVIICSDFQEALSLLVYRNLWYMDVQVCFLKVLFKTWIDHFFQISTEISSDGRLKTLITFRLINLFDWSVPC